MPIPNEILKLKPKNTRVKATSDPNVFNVIKRTCITKNGKSYPVELGVIGKIINKEYVEIKKKTYEIDIKNYGGFALTEKLNNDLFMDLLKYYPLDDAKKIYTIASLRALNEDIKNEEILTEYKTSFISEKYQNCGLSANTISDFLDDIGKQTSVIEAFMNYRLNKFANNPIVIDGMLKSNTSKTNIFSEYSRKSRIKGTMDINLLYAYDLVTEEPVASGVYPGNMLDYTAFRDFLARFSFKNGFLIMDKGFSDKESKAIMSAQGVKYLIPIKLNQTKNKLNYKEGFSYCFKFFDDMIRAKKVEVNDTFYYCYKSTKHKAMQDSRYMEKVSRLNLYSEDDYLSKEETFGLIIFESNADLPLKEIYYAYKKRWEIEELFRTFKNILDQSEENVHGTYRLIASEFINFISTIMLSRIRNYLIKLKILEKYSFPNVIRYLSKILKKRAPRNNDTWVKTKTLKYIEELAKNLGI